MYGYQPCTEFEARTGSTWPLNIGQVYTTLGRLERDGLVVSQGADDEGHAYLRHHRRRPRRGAPLVRDAGWPGDPAA